MKLSRKIGASIVMAALSLLVASCVTAGSTAAGQRFGVRVGMSFEDASAVLTRRGFQQDPPMQMADEMCGLRRPGPDETIQSFHDRDNQTTVCLFVGADRVGAIAWEGTWM
jgi:hypothetical protein